MDDQTGQAEGISFQLKYSVTEDEAIEFSRIRRGFDRSKGRRSWKIAALGILGLGIYFWVSDGFSVIYIAQIGFALLILLDVDQRLHERRIRDQFRGSPVSRAPMSETVDEFGFKGRKEYEASSMTYEHPWESMRFAVVSPSLFVLRYPGGTGFIPRRAFASEAEARAFEGLLRRKLGNRLRSVG
jgi:YcxB-like protein